jgi:hypothetical protein
MNETSDRLPTGPDDTPVNVGVVSSLNLSPRFEVVGVDSRTTQAIRPNHGVQAGTSAPLESGRSGLVSDETSDRLPTESENTSDTSLRRRRFEHGLDQLMVRLLLDLATISQVKAAPTEVQAADANAIRLPVSRSGRALTEDPVGQLAADYKQAGRVKDVAKRIGLKVQIATRAQTEIRSCRFSRRHAPDLGTQDGRLAVARYAREHGTRRAAETYCQNPDDPRSVDSMQRNCRRYLVELGKIDGAR